MPLYLLTMFSKNQKVNLTQSEKNILKSYVKQLSKGDIHERSIQQHKKRP